MGLDPNKRTGFIQLLHSYQAVASRKYVRLQRQADEQFVPRWFMI